MTPQRRDVLAKFTVSDTQTDMLLGEPKSAICVQRFDDSLNSAIHTTYRSWLRSSSMREPRDPPSKVVSHFVQFDSPGGCRKSDEPRYDYNTGEAGEGQDTVQRKSTNAMPYPYGDLVGT